MSVTFELLGKPRSPKKHEGEWGYHVDFSKPDWDISHAGYTELPVWMFPEQGRYPKSVHRMTLSFDRDGEPTEETTVGDERATLSGTFDTEGNGGMDIEDPGNVDSWLALEPAEQVPDWLFEEDVEGAFVIDIEYDHERSLDQPRMTPKEVRRKRNPAGHTTPGVKPVWRRDLDVSDAGQIVFDGERVLIPTGDGVTAVDAATGEVAWQNDVVSSDEAALGLGQDTVYAVSPNGCAAALDSTTGESRWYFETDGSPATNYPIAVSREAGATNGSNELAVFWSGEQTVRAVESTTGTARWSLEFDQDWVGSITIADTLALVLVEDSVHGVDLETGVRRWAVDLDPERGVGIPRLYGPGAGGDRICVTYGEKPTDLWCLDVESGERIWHRTMEPYVKCADLEGEQLYTREWEGYPVNAIDLSDGEVVHSHQIGGSSLVVGPETIHSEVTPGMLEAYDRDSDALRWRYDTAWHETTGDEVVPQLNDSAWPVATGDEAVYAVGDGEVLALAVTGTTRLSEEAVAAAPGESPVRELVLDEQTDQRLFYPEAELPYYAHEDARFETIIAIGRARDDVTDQRQRDAERVTEFEASVDRTDEGLVVLELAPIDLDTDTDGEVPARAAIAADRLPEYLQNPGDEAVLAVYLEYDEDATPEEDKPELYRS